MATSTTMRLVMALSLLVLAVSLVSAESSLRKSAGRRLLQSGGPPPDLDAIVRASEAAKAKAAAAIVTSEENVAAARQAFRTIEDSAERFEARVQINNLVHVVADVRAMATQATDLADNAIKLVQEAAPALENKADAEATVEDFERKKDYWSYFYGIDKWRDAMEPLREALSAAKATSDKIVAAAQQKAADAAAMASRAEEEARQ